MQEIFEKVMPLIPLRGLAVFPYMAISFDAGRDKTVAAVEEAMERDKMCLLVSQKNPQSNDIGPGDIFEVGSIARIKQVLKLPGGSVRVFAEGVMRGRIDRFIRHTPYFEAIVKECEQGEPVDELLAEALGRKLSESFEAYARVSGKVNGEMLLSALVEEDLGKICDAMAAGVLVNLEDKQEILECFDVQKRAEKLLEIMRRETEIMKLEARIQQTVKQNLEKAQREYYLREQLKVVRKELGDDAEGEDEIDALKARLEALTLSDEARTKVGREMRRLEQLPSGSHEAPGIRTYLELMADLPWGIKTEVNYDLVNARKVLDDEHYGLVKVKDRVVEHLAVCKLKDSANGAILCLVGPPGVGKTSIATSIAHATGRKFTRMSLGGVRDEADIRGHRRTYIGAIPGRMISAVKQAGSMNPLILLDEIDKLGNDFRGDPASALLEVLDSNQNSTFRDHFLELPFDLSNVMFITTANSMDTIPKPLLDRMDVIELSSYTDEEKLEIGRRHLLKKQLEQHGLPNKAVVLPDESLKLIVEQYTREAGVRNLERRIGDICRKVAVTVVTEGKKRVTVTPRKVEKLLGPPRYKRESREGGDKVGVANGMAWTSVGGELLSIEVAVIKGSGKLELTGRLGDVMKESAWAAYTYIRTHAAEWNIDPLFYEKNDIHIHIPEGAVPKDGPSAGVTMACAMVSALSGISVRDDVAMTGEVSIRGRVLAVGGLKEKTLAALREGMTTVILPKENMRDLPDLAESARRELRFVFADELHTVFETAFSVRKAVVQNAELPPIVVETVAKVMS